MNHCTNFLARDNTDPGHNFGQFSDEDGRSRICESWRFPIIDTYSDGKDPDKEPGGEAVEGVLAESVMSSVNWAEVVQKSVAAGVVVDEIREELAALGLLIAPFSPEYAEMAGRLWLQTRQLGCCWETVLV